MRIYTRNGDDGTTGLFGGNRVPKDDLRIESYGTVDELNAFLGRLIEHPELNDELKFFRGIQAELFSIGSHLATVEDKMQAMLPKLNPNSISEFENWMDLVHEKVPPLKNFLLPGGHPSVADAHIARSICRRAERRVVALSRVETVDIEIIKYLNRLSDVLFTTARLLSFLTKTDEITWKVEND
ncbi:MAG: ATP:cob(I)alamin adenosyltransferase [Crocinitomicaceae bacterium]|nr:ATP:cob(I)alamin adenosyltransferase [Crocinitomicaceae bacterium]|tara:strand:- start:2653 stop:3204 length:552 start_codon:yes stop_codon:yes gene_type:complete